MKLNWLWTLGVGVALFFVTNVTMQSTGNPNFFPTVIMLGSFVVPVAFITFFYEHIRDRDIPLSVLGGSFLLGGAIGTVAAGLLEYSTLTSSSVSSLFGVGLIEESAKIIVPVVLFLGWKYRHQADGLLFGVTVGMGFAALETMGYALVTLIQSQGDVTAMNQVLLVRGLLAPAGHGAWTGIICAVLWRERARAGKVTINAWVIGAFILAVVLHAAWDIVNSQSSNAVAYGGMLAVALVSLGVLFALYASARKEVGQTPAAEKAQTI
ncbi:Protease prsW family protein [Dehalogenimonas formicexedens]|uniref:Protease prsW family protein n=1 Tax=Dehalogenimonas formicexedens TaxID=1839801 RepID=A0A1P8F4L5_9CHLR|nr:PrsW family intramembrane metalloprotease [Dehalogenimonas formicexedens]APV43416.1 Protease prsW family protein [Dehalogenimonas formicexedens]